MPSPAEAAAGKPSPRELARAFGPLLSAARPEAGRAPADATQLAPAACHEFYAAHPADETAAAGFALCALAQAAPARPILWVRQLFATSEAGALYPPGLCELGLDPGRIILVQARDPAAVLQAALDGARCRGLSGVLAEFWEGAKAYDLVASRRLALAVKASGVTLAVLRVGAQPSPSAAETRWRVRAAPSRPQPAKAPGPPAFELTLLRSRSGQEGQRHDVEWNRNARRFEPLTESFAEPRVTDAARAADGTCAPLSGAVVSVSFDRASRAAPPGIRRAG